MRMRTWVFGGAVALSVGGCSGSSVTVPTAADAEPSPSMAAPEAGADGAASVVPDASTAPPVDGGAPAGPDGTPVRTACTGVFGSGLAATFGRLDGYLVAVVPPGHNGCSSDANHLHLQVKASGAVYDIAVTMVSDLTPTMPDVFVVDKDAPLANGAWTEGWHAGDRFDYVANLGLHAGDFVATPAAPLASKIEAALANVNHIAVYATGYGPGGAHKVHRNGGGADGALVIEPLSAKPHVFAFHFATQSF